jgi:hypothetical protein
MNALYETIDKLKEENEMLKLDNRILQADLLLWQLSKDGVLSHLLELNAENIQLKAALELVKEK